MRTSIICVVKYHQSDVTYMVNPDWFGSNWCKKIGLFSFKAFIIFMGKMKCHQSLAKRKHGSFVAWTSLQVATVIYFVFIKMNRPPCLYWQWIYVPWISNGFPSPLSVFPFISSRFPLQVFSRASFFSSETCDEWPEEGFREPSGDSSLGTLTVEEGTLTVYSINNYI